MKEIVWLLIIVFLVGVLVGCNVGSFRNTQQTVIGDGSGNPIFVLDKKGNWVSVGAASDELLAMRGLCRCENGTIVSQ